MAKPIYGKDKILMFRLYSQRTQANATKLALQTSHTWKYEAKSDSTDTKDGAINSPATPVATLEINAITSADDVNKMLKQAVLNSELLEVWEIDLSQPVADQEGKYAATYAQGYMQSWEVPAEVGKLAELKTEMNIDQIPQEGIATLTSEQESEIQYAFQDTNKVVESPAEQHY